MVDNVAPAPVSGAAEPYSETDSGTHAVPPKPLLIMYAIALIFTLGAGQIIIGVPLLFLVFFTQVDPGVLADAGMLSEALLDFSVSEPGIAASLAGTAVAFVLTFGVAVGWPALWERINKRKAVKGAWLARRPARIIKWWMIPLAVLPVLGLTAAISLLAGDPNVEIQELLFSSPALAVAASLVVTTIVPITEEFVFRGALYNAALPQEELTAEKPNYRRHIAAFIIATLAFAGVHLLAGFGTVSSIIMILILSLFLTALRTISGSVWPPVIAHTLWNLIAAAGYIVSAFGVGV